MRKNEGKEIEDWSEEDQTTFRAAEGTAEYAKCVEISTQSAIKEMVLPGASRRPRARSSSGSVSSMPPA